MSTSRRGLIFTQISLAILCAGCAGQTPPPEPHRPPCRERSAAENPALRAVLETGGLTPERIGRIRCNSNVRWEPSLSGYARQIVARINKEYGIQPDSEQRERAVHHALGYLVRTYFDQTSPHNLGATVLRGHTYVTPAGHTRPLVLFRSAVTTRAGGTCPCFESLIRSGQVRHVVNLYGGTFPFRDLIDRERRLARRLGASYLDAAASARLRYRGLIEHPDDYERNKRRAMRHLAELIRDHLLRPGGAAPRGNLYVHCGGGMHRSGMLFGVIQRCINGEPMDRIEAEYRRHSGYVSSEQPGGYEELNVRFIREFDCSLLEARPRKP